MFFIGLNFQHTVAVDIIFHCFFFPSICHLYFLGYLYEIFCFWWNARLFFHLKKKSECKMRMHGTLNKISLKLNKIYKMYIIICVPKNAIHSTCLRLPINFVVSFFADIIEQKVWNIVWCSKKIEFRWNFPCSHFFFLSSAIQVLFKNISSDKITKKWFRIVAIYLLAKPSWFSFNTIFCSWMDGTEKVGKQKIDCV